MSNALALAHVTQALALLLESNLGPEIDMAVKVEPRKPPADPPTEPTISVFLYQVTPDTSQRNNDLPTRAADGTLVKRPVAALDLHFLITAYGDETELVGQRLIGSVVRALHEIPVLPKDIIELAGERPYLAGSDLAESAQRVRFTPTVMDVDETSKLWGMLYQTPYTLSVVYQAALVLIDGRETPVAGKPVERPEVRVLPFGAPGAPVPPGAEPSPDATSNDRSAGDAGKQETETPARTSAKKAARTPAKAVAKSPAKAPARTRKTAPRAAKPAQE
ncbi:Pvc16 family protein [Streptomyces sp. NBC_00056]|uniref:Pvc16 family protein n=1 Tax=unclassified Streptomyces TaxID=2593676 RepID=UPI002250A8AE|nr:MULTISPECIES: Pvc16 family protein [unclassified Streptomyces]MCX5440323.1 Pvc16 family protein [Streptomyces sp. NBC_00063]WUB93277.1 Pvc16 family protein [Streptomyces sp. NBC_00569]